MLKSAICNILHYFLQASSSETAESKASLGFFSQMFSDFAAPLYEEDEQDFLSEDREPEDPSVEDEKGDEDQTDAIYETSNYGEDKKPSFASSQFEKSVTENVNPAQTAEVKTDSGGATKSDTDQAKGEDQPLPNANKEGNASGSLPHSSSANAENKNPEPPGEPDVGIDGRLEEGSIDLDRLQAELESAVNTKNESSVEQTDNKGINSQEEKQQVNNNRRQFEQDLTVNSVNAEDLNTETLVKEERAKKEAEIDSADENTHWGRQDPEYLSTETSVKEEPAKKEAEIDSAGENRGRQDPEQEEPRSTDSSAVKPFDKKQPEYEDGATELSDEDLEHLRVKSKPSQVEVPLDALEEKEQDLRKNNKEEAELLEVKRKLRLEKEKKNGEEKKKVLDEQSRSLRLEENGDAEKKRKAMEEQTRKLKLEKEKRIAEDKKKTMEEQSRNLRLEKERRDEEEKKKATEEQTRRLMQEKEQRIAEERRKKAMEEHARKVRLEKEKEKEKKAAEEEKQRKVEQQRKEEEARQLRLESLKKQRQQIEETEKMERLRRKGKDISLKKISGTERKGKEVDDKVPEDEGIDQEKVNPTQEKGKTNEDNKDEEHMKIKGAFDQKMAQEEAALKRRLEMLSEERRKFEKMAEEYRVSKKERQQKEQKAKKLSTKHSAESDLRKAATVVSPLSKQLKTSRGQGWYMYSTM